MAPHEATRWTVRNRDSFEYLFPTLDCSTDFTTSMCGLTTTTGGVTQGWEVSVERCIATKPVVTEFFVIDIARVPRNNRCPAGTFITRRDGHKDIYSKLNQLTLTNWLRLPDGSSKSAPSGRHTARMTCGCSAAGEEQ